MEREGGRLGGGCQCYRLHVLSSLINHCKATLLPSTFLFRTYVVLFLGKTSVFNLDFCIFVERLKINYPFANNTRVLRL